MFPVALSARAAESLVCSSSGERRTVGSTGSFTVRAEGTVERGAVEELRTWARGLRRRFGDISDMADGMIEKWNGDEWKRRRQLSLTSGNVR